MSTRRTTPPEALSGAVRCGWNQCVQAAEPSLGNDQAVAKADAIVRNALQEAGADIFRARSLLNVNWRRFA
jgi:hypothetical protein